MDFYYEILKKKYERLYNSEIEKNKDILIESFVEYYGEQHRDEIISRFNELTFVYFINWEGLSIALKEASFKEKDSTKFEDFNKFLKYRENDDNLFYDSFIGS